MVNKPMTIKIYAYQARGTTASGSCNAKMCVIKMPALKEFTRPHLFILQAYSVSSPPSLHRQNEQLPHLTQRCLEKCQSCSRYPANAFCLCPFLSTHILDTALKECINPWLWTLVNQIASLSLCPSASAFHKQSDNGSHMRHWLRTQDFLCGI